MEKLAEVLNKLLDSPPAIAIVLGAILLGLWLAGGVTYNGWFPITGLAERSFAGVLGLLSICFGFWKTIESSNRYPKAKDFGITIANPRPADTVDYVDVRGTILKKPLPVGYTVRALRVYPRNNGFIPNGRVQIDPDTNTWEVIHFDIGGEPGDRRDIEIWLVGPDGAALLDYWDKAHSVHRKPMEKLMTLTGAYREWLPPMEVRTKDMIPCARVSVTRKVK